ncbi:NAD(P)H-binding protein [Paraconexibacter sp.]|uniref:NAD(P)H-binding protein n=1 Tax=Paraconexibacter sp. TaxID=2949640 RepID=UPI00356A6DC1
MTAIHPSSERTAVLLTGASGFVGSALLPALKDVGAIRCLVRDASRLQTSGDVHVVEADLTDSDSLAPALEGMDEAYYLVHSMEPGGGQDYVERDRRAATNYVQAAREAGIRRTIYLGGIGGGDESSEHLESRREVEEVLAGAGPEFVALRASMIVGAKSASFGTLVQIVDRLPVLAMPAWRDRSTQPIAIDDVVACLVAAREVKPGAYEIAGPDTLTFAEMTEVIADLLGKTHRSVPLPFSNAKLEAAMASLVTDEDQELLEPLMEGLHGDLVVSDNQIERTFGVRPTPFADAARTAIEGMTGVETADAQPAAES